MPLFHEVLGFTDLGRINPLNMFQFFIILYFSVSFHECAHAWMANRCGDDTARLQGRLTLNPLAHIDPIGTIIVPLMMMLFGGGMLIGWAKPVPVNPLRFNDYRKGQFLTSVVGPMSNLVLMIAGALIVRLLIILSLRKVEVDVFMGFFLKFTMLNMVLCIFNLIPVPPLDGSHILRLHLRGEALATYERFFVPYGFFILMILVMSGALGPLFALGQWVVSRIMTAGIGLG